MSAFARHNIKHLSASSLNLWAEHPGLWALRYLGQVKDEDSPAVWRGKAVEDGLTALLHGRDPLETALATFEANAQGEVSDEISEQRRAIKPMVNVLLRAPLNGNSLIGTQFKIEHWLDGVSVPFIGYIDYLFDDSLIDLKTTLRCPSAPKISHVRQVALYTAAKDKPASLLYVTDKKFALYPVSAEDSEKALDDLRGYALSLERFLSRVDSAVDALHCLPLNPDDFRVNEQTIEARKVLMGAMQ